MADSDVAAAAGHPARHRPAGRATGESADEIRSARSPPPTATTCCSPRRRSGFEGLVWILPGGRGGAGAGRRCRPRSPGGGARPTSTATDEDRALVEQALARTVSATDAGRAGGPRGAARLPPALPRGPRARARRGRRRRARLRGPEGRLHGPRGRGAPRARGGPALPPCAGGAPTHPWPRPWRSGSACWPSPALAGVLVAQAAGRRDADQVITGDIRQSVTEKLNEAGRRGWRGRPDRGHRALRRGARRTIPATPRPSPTRAGCSRSPVTRRTGLDVLARRRHRQPRRTPTCTPSSPSSSSATAWSSRLAASSTASTRSTRPPPSETSRPTSARQVDAALGPRQPRPPRPRRPASVLARWWEVAALGEAALAVTGEHPRRRLLPRAARPSAWCRRLTSASSRSGITSPWLQSAAGAPRSSSASSSAPTKPLPLREAVVLLDDEAEVVGQRQERVDAAAKGAGHQPDDAGLGQLVAQRIGLLLTAPRQPPGAVRPIAAIGGCPRRRGERRRASPPAPRYPHPAMPPVRRIPGSRDVASGRPRRNISRTRTTGTSRCRVRKTTTQPLKNADGQAVRRAVAGLGLRQLDDRRGTCACRATRPSGARAACGDAARRLSVPPRRRARVQARR